MGHLNKYRIENDVPGSIINSIKGSCCTLGAIRGTEAVSNSPSPESAAQSGKLLPHYPLDSQPQKLGYCLFNGIIAKN